MGSLTAAMYQGTVLRSSGSPIFNIQRPEGIGEQDEREMLDTLRWYNERHLESRRDDSDLAARIAAYELSFRMQMAAPELVDLSKETPITRKLYGMDDPVTADYGLKCLLARRLVERGVRFIQLYSGGATGKDWDGHNQCDKNHLDIARTVDKPIAGLLADLKSRGLLDSTLVIWGGEFGRTPMTDGNANGGIGGGRDHNPYGFSVWMAGGGIHGGKVIGATDDIGLRAVEDKVHVHDLHATLLSLLGVDHKRLTYLYQGRNFRLSDVGGENNLAPRLLQA
jgi:membrane-anchored protein YejM (alkaline phosphatase superfamily)